MTQAIIVGTRVQVVAVGGGLFYSNNVEKIGVVKRVEDDIVHVQFDDGQRDYGRKSDVKVVTPAIVQTVIGELKVGARVKVTTHQGGAFYSRSYDKIGVVTQLTAVAVHVRFEDGTEDYGRIDAVTVLQKIDKDGFISNEGNLLGTLPAPRGTKLDILYNDGTIILDLPIGDGTSKTSSNYPQRSYSATTWRFTGTGGATIKGYRFPANTQTLDVQLAALKAELEGVKAEITTAEAGVVTAQAKVAVAEAKRVALVGRLSKHGIQFIGEQSAVVTAAQAAEAGTLVEDTLLLCNTPEDADEHTAGKTYKVIRVDAHNDRQTYKLESNDGYGYWVRNESLEGFTVVA